MQFTAGPSVIILALIAVATLLEALLPLRAQPRNAGGRLPTNVGLSLMTLALGLLLNGALAAGAAYLQARGHGLLPWLGIEGLGATLFALAVLDLAAYAVHVFMHRCPWAWRVHLVHHSDVCVDATTALRQHPFEGLLRFAFAAAAAWSLGASPAAVALYRALSAINAVFEHANIRLPRTISRALEWLWVTPDMHKVHHSRARAQTDSNYANLFAFYDRLFGTFNHATNAATLVYGIEGYESGPHQGLEGALRLAFRR